MSNGDRFPLQELVSLRDLEMYEAELLRTRTDFQKHSQNLVIQIVLFLPG